MISTRLKVQTLAQAGHECRALCTARFETSVPFTIDEHLTGLGVPLITEPGKPQLKSRDKRKSSGSDGATAPRPVTRLKFRSVDVTMLRTEHNRGDEVNALEADQFLDLLIEQIKSFRPNVLLTCGSHPIVQESLRLARQRNVTTVFSLNNKGYDSRHYFEHVDHVLSTSRYLADMYHRQIGLRSTPLEMFDWSEIAAPSESRAFVTFINPKPHKGVMLFARLADMLGSRRPDIPVLIVQSTQSAGFLNSIPGFDFSKYPQIMAAPPVPRPADIFALTKILLVPSVFEALGRVAVEAMINGVPTLVSDRGELGELIGRDWEHGGGGKTIALPAWMTPGSSGVPSEEEAQPWFDAVCQLWDDSALYERVAGQAMKIGKSRFSEELGRRAVLDYFTKLGPGGNLFTK